MADLRNAAYRVIASSIHIRRLRCAFHWFAFVNVYVKNLLDLAVAAVIWWICGYGIAFSTEDVGTKFNRVIGLGLFFARGEVSPLGGVQLQGMTIPFLSNVRSCRPALAILLAIFVLQEPVPSHAWGLTFHVRVLNIYTCIVRSRNV